VVTKSGYTADEDFTAADAVFDYIGDGGHAQFGLNDLRLKSPLWLGCGEEESSSTVGEEEFCIYNSQDSIDEGAK
jgi:hypothetical protein